MEGLERRLGRNRAGDTVSGAESGGGTRSERGNPQKPGDFSLITRINYKSH